MLARVGVVFASSWYVFLTYIYDARSHLYQIMVFSFMGFLNFAHHLVFQESFGIVVL